jgi:hypothetical protein
MRRLIVALFMAWAPVAIAVGAEPARPHNILLFVVEGLRPGMINDQTAPAISDLLKRGVHFSNSHAVFPTLGTPNAAALATGHLPGDTGDFGDTIHTAFSVRVAGDTQTPPLESDPVLGEIDDHFAGDYLNEETFLRAAAQANLSTAVVGRTGPSLIFDHTERTGQQTVVVDDQTGHPGGIPLSPGMQAALHELAMPAEAPIHGDNFGDPAAKLSGTPDWFVGVTTRAVLPMFKNRGKPFILVFWSHDPNGIPGINGPASLSAIKQGDRELTKLLASLKELGLDATTDVILTSDHGLSTISKESATSYAATQSYKDVPPALLPPGFVAIDIAHGLRMKLFDPDADGALAKSSPLPAGSFPTRGNGLIGDEPAHPSVVVAANGGSDLIYLPAQDKALAARVIQILSVQDYVSGLFVDSRLGTMPGTLSLAAIGLEGTAFTPTPAIIVNFRSFSLGCADPTTCGVEVSDTVRQQGQGSYGSFSRADTRNVMGAIGPGFRVAYRDPAPVSNADIGKTISWLLGLKPKEKGTRVGRVLTEATPNGAMVGSRPLVIRSEPDSADVTTVVKYQAIGLTRYFDAAGYPGRTLGLD